MKLVLLEQGERPTDIQTTIKDFEGTMEQYKDVVIQEVLSNSDLRLLDYYEGDDGTFVLRYFSKSMNKMIQSYAFPLKLS